MNLKHERRNKEFKDEISNLIAECEVFLRTQETNEKNGIPYETQQFSYISSQRGLTQLRT